MARGFISATSTGGGKTEAALRKMQDRGRVLAILNEYGSIGVQALVEATPVGEGTTAAAWYYEITQGEGGYSLVFRNSHVSDGELIAILLHYGHGTRNGGYVTGRNYINDAIQSIFDRIAIDAWKVVISE